MTRRELSKSLTGLKNRILLAAGKGDLRLVDDEPKIQEVQIEALKDEILSEIQRMQNYGFSSVPPHGAECVFVAVGGRRDNAVVVAMDHPEYRLKDQGEGEVAVHGLGLDDQCLIFLKDNNDAILRVKGTLTIETGALKIKRIT